LSRLRFFFFIGTPKQRIGIAFGPSVTARSEKGQRLKPHQLLVLFGTAEAAPYKKSTNRTRCLQLPPTSEMESKPVKMPRRSQKTGGLLQFAAAR
jgi:hypothetical protein